MRVCCSPQAAAAVGIKTRMPESCGEGDSAADSRPSWNRYGFPV